MMKNGNIYFFAAALLLAAGCARQEPKLDIQTASNEINVIEAVGPDTAIVTETAIVHDDKSETIEAVQSEKDKAGAVAVKQEF